MTAPIAAAALGEAGGAAAGAGEAAGAGRAAAAASKTPKAPTMDGGNAPTRSALPSSRPRTGGGGKGGGKGKGGGGGSAAGSAAGSAFGSSSGGLLGKGKGGGRAAAGRRVLVAEFVLCALILALSPLTDRHRDDTGGMFVKRASAVTALFIILGLVSSAGPRAARLSAAFGGVVTLALLVSDRSVFSALAARFNAGPGAGPAGPPANPVPGVPDGGSPPPGPGARPAPPVNITRRPFPTNARTL